MTDAIVSSIPREVEAKLLVPTVSDLRAIARLGHLGTYPLLPRATVRLHTTYLDTPELTLARNGIAMRLRRCGKHWEATVKWAGRVDGDVHERPELTVALARPPILPFPLPPGLLYTHLAALTAGRPLAPVLVSEIHRRQFDVLPAAPAAALAEPPLPVAELALDRVHLRAPQDGRPETTYCEVEVECRHGERRDITNLARALRLGFGLLPSTESKFSRGLALLYGSGIVGSDNQRMVTSDTMQAAVRHVIARQLHRLRLNDPGARLGEDPEALHDMRVATRRLRAAVRILAAGIPVRLQARLDHELRWLGELLGGVRDLDVQLAKLDAFAAAAPAGFRPAFKRLREHLAGERTRSRARMLEGLDTPRYFRLLLRLERFAYSEPPRRPVTAAALEPICVAGPRALKKAFRHLTKRGDKIHTMPHPEDLHTMRIRAKRLRYLLEFLQELTGKPGRLLVKRLTELQDLLGSYHDAVVAADFVRTYVEGPGVQLPPASMVALGALVARELRVAEQKRADFEATWRRFSRKRTIEASRDVLRRLRKPQMPAAPPAPPAAEPPAAAGGEAP